MKIVYKTCALLSALSLTAAPLMAQSMAAPSAQRLSLANAGIARVSAKTTKANKAAPLLLLVVGTLAAGGAAAAATNVLSNKKSASQ